MSYENPRPAKLLVPLQSKTVGKDEFKMHRAGRKVTVQRSPAEAGIYLVWFAKNQYAKVEAMKLIETIEYTDGRPKY